MGKLTYRFLILSIVAILFADFIHAQLPANFGELIDSRDLGSQTPTPDRYLIGIQFAEGALWVTGSDPDDYWQHKLYKFNQNGTELLETYSYGIEAAGWKDLAYDGEYLYVTDLDTIRQLNLANGEKTGVTIPAPFYYNRGLAYNPLNDHFYVSGEGGFNIYEIDRNGNIAGAIGGTSGNYYVGLAVDTVSPGGPFLWAYTNEEDGYSLILKAKQVSLQTNQFTGVEFNGASISNIINETAGGATVMVDTATDSVTLVTINIRNGNSQDQFEYAMFYDITRNEIPGPQITVDPPSIQNTLPTGDSADVLINVFNDGDSPLFWSAYVETPGQDTTDNLGDLLSSFNATQQSGNNDRGINGITFLNDRLWVNGRNFPSSQSAIYEFDKNGNLLSTHPYNTISSNGFFSITTDGEYLYGEDTYTITQINPDNFTVEGYILKSSGSYQDMTYDPQTDHFWGGNGVGLINEFDRDGEIVNQYITSYAIKGMAWDRWSPGGPFLWIWVESENGSSIEAIRLDPHTCTPVDEGFQGAVFSTDSLFQDSPKGAVITNEWQENKVSFLGIHNAVIINGNDTITNTDFIAAYDLDVVAPPSWISLMNPSNGTILPGETEQFTVRLRSLMDDTLMMASIRISNNDILNQDLSIPVSFQMTSSFITSIDDFSGSSGMILGQNYPNPSDNYTIIPVRMVKEEYIKLTVYDAMGNIIKAIAEDVMQAGDHEFTLHTDELSPGIYFYTLQSKTGVITKRMIIK